MIPGHLKRDDVVTLLQGLNKAVADARIRADIYVYGGGGFVLNHTFREATKDIDGYMPDADAVSLVQNQTAMLATQHGLELYCQGWLDVNNLDLSAFVSARDTFFDVATYTPTAPALMVHTLKAAPQLALKLIRMTPTPKDLSDMAALCAQQSIDNRDKLTAHWQRYAPLLPANVTDHVDAYHLEKRWMEISFTRGQMRAALA